MPFYWPGLSFASGAVQLSARNPVIASSKLVPPQRAFSPPAVQHPAAHSQGGFEVTELEEPNIALTKRN